MLHSTTLKRPPGRLPIFLLAPILREPLLHFFLIGSLLFAVGAWHRARTDDHTIVVTANEVQHLRDAYRQQFGGDPPPAALRQMVDKFIDEEVLYRAGLARGLDRDDEIVRRRIVQKMQFAEQDLAPPPEPSLAQLDAFYQSHLALYREPARVTFSHIFFASDASQAEASRSRAEHLLPTLSDAKARAPELGDNFPDLYDYAEFGPEQALHLFGESELTERLFDAPVGHWAGPYRSSYGWHLVFIAGREPEQTLPFDAVRDRVRADAMAAWGEETNRQAFAALKAQYAVVRDDREAASP
jgi:hypothetical protein